MRAPECFGPLRLLRNRNQLIIDNDNKQFARKNTRLFGYKKKELPHYEGVLFLTGGGYCAMLRFFLRSKYKAIASNCAKLEYPARASSAQIYVSLYFIGDGRSPVSGARGGDIGGFSPAPAGFWNHPVSTHRAEESARTGAFQYSAL